MFIDKQTALRAVKSLVFIKKIGGECNSKRWGEKIERE